MVEAVFWASLSLIAYAYFGYPILVALWPFLRAVRRGRCQPSITFVVAVRNEERRIDRKIRHLLSIPYPGPREIVVVSDGSTDGTGQRLRAWAGTPDVHITLLPERQGKANALNIAMGQARGEIVIFNDVRQELAEDAVPLLLENFADPEVGCASGELHFVSEGGQEQLKSTLYWKYERWLRHRESLSGSVMGGTGACCAIRRELFRPLPPGLILDDVYTPLQIALAGLRVIHDERVRFFDIEAGSEKQEFQRKVRTLSGNYQLLRYLPRLLMPGRIGFQFFSHKIMRLLVPVLMVVLFAAAALAHGWFYRLAFAAQAAFYLIGAGSLAMRRRLPAILGIPGAFLTLNSAAAVALFYFMTGREAKWKTP